MKLIVYAVACLLIARSPATAQDIIEFTCGGAISYRGGDHGDGLGLRFSVDFRQLTVTINGKPLKLTKAGNEGLSFEGPFAWPDRKDGWRTGEIDRQAGQGSMTEYDGGPRRRVAENLVLSCHPRPLYPRVTPNSTQPSSR
jgi:hypothetical protein